MSNFVVSARKYRPVRFDEVVGQQHVSQTLKNALQTDHLAHAFLFCGPRGVGKTTCARILAKVLNCENLSEDHEACNACSSCTAFNENASFNITELDAASNNSVEHIRALIEQVRFQPQQGKYKVFIIDEVHMLSQQAFNAFLKTLEEPPPYAIFILATTEKHKIIPTILSRCQIFDFRRIQVADMVKHLQSICEQEGIEASKDALHIISQKADGALRDSLSIFDRIVSFSGKKISYEDVIENLNVLDYDYFFKIVDALLEEDIAKVMLTFDDISRKGFEPDIFINGLAEHIRNLLVCKDEQTLALLEVSDSLIERYQSQATLTPSSLLLTALNICNECDVNYKLARNKRLHVEMAIIKMTHINRVVELARSPQQGIEKKTLDQTKSVVKPQPTTVSTPERREKPPSIVQEEKKELNSPKQALNNEPTKNNTTPSIKPVVEVSNSIASDSKHVIQKIPSFAELENTIDADTQEEASNTVFTSHDLQDAWMAYATTVTSPSVKSVLKSTELVLEDQKVVATVGTKMAKGMLQQERELMPYLRSQLKIARLAIEIRIDPSKSPIIDKPKPKKLMTVKEKYDQMCQINPLIQEMRKRFDLKIDSD